MTQEKCYNENITAEQVLAEYLDKRTTDNDSDEECNEARRRACEEKKECRCTCKLGKICAHCRIRKLCADIFKGNNDTQPTEKDCGKCEPSSSAVFNICKTESNDCRPYLARVFSELKDLYDIKERQKSGFEINKKCELQLQGNKIPHSKSKHSSIRELEKLDEKENRRSSGGQEPSIRETKCKTRRPRKKGGGGGDQPCRKR